ncbi:uncharacterized protein [Henckelia pumila]|uniref:uncharacterized protein n=1 Tax=Henckelia pumila TaxID=405737 RepID=UPI003C6E8E88
MGDMTATPMETLLKRFQSFKPPTLKETENSVECESWLEDIEELFESLDYADDRRVKLVIHQLHEVAKVSYRKKKGAEFASLQQGQFNIEQYVAKFTSLLKFAPHIADSDEAQADQFINGLNPDVFTLVNAGRPNNFADALDRAKGAEAGLLRQRGVHFVPAPVRQPQEQPQIPPPPRFEKGGSSSGKNNFFKGKTKQLKRSRGSSSSSSGSKQFRAGHKSSGSEVYCTKCGGRHASDQCQGVFGSCHICNQTGHFASVCPQRGLGGSQGTGSSRPVAQSTSSVHSLQPQTQQQGRGGGIHFVSQTPRHQDRVFALTEEQAHASPDDVIAGNCFLCGYPAYVLVDTGASHTFISEQFALLHSLPVESLSTIVSISSPLGKGKVSMNSVQNCSLYYDGNEIELDCIVLDLSDFDCIIDIDMLTKYRATVDCCKKIVRFRPEMADEWKFYASKFVGLVGRKIRRKYAILRTSPPKKLARGARRRYPLISTIG